MSEIVIGLDGGGTHTRVLAADLTGRIVAFADGEGSNPQHDPRAEANGRAAIEAVLDAAGRRPEQVACLVAGLAGLDDPEDNAWAERLTAVPGLTGPRLHVNDAVIAHAGALQSQPGIVAICGTGSIVFGVTETGRHVRNYDFQHYAPGAARHLATEALFRIMAGALDEQDRALISQVLDFWGVTSVAALAALGADRFASDGVERNYRFGAMAPLVTAAALAGSPLARAVCDRAAQTVAMGIRLVGTAFTLERVPVALIGGSVRSRYMQQAVAESLRASGRQYELVAPALSPVAGAILMALAQLGRGGERTTALLAQSLPAAASPGGDAPVPA